MKKTISLLLVVAFALTTALTAFGYTENKISVGNEKNTAEVLQDGFLKSGEEYLFPVSVSIDGAASTPLTEEILKDYNFKIQNTGKQDSMSKFELIKILGEYYISANVKEGYPIKSTEEEYTLEFYKKSGVKNETELVLTFETGNKAVDDSFVDALEKEDEIEVSNDTPVFTEEQLGRITRKNNYKNVTFVGENWDYTVNVTDIEGVNLYNTLKPNMDLVNNNPSNNFEFISFPANTKFKINGLLKLNVEDISEEYLQKFYVYRDNGEKLVPVAASYNYEDDILTISTSVLGNFVITDKQLSNLVTGESSDNSQNTGDSSIVNPSTGAVA